MSRLLASARCLAGLLALALPALGTGCASSTDTAPGSKGASHDAGPRAKATAPNIVFVFADDLGYGDLGVYGSTTIQTPNLDGLAKQGVRLTQFYAGSTVCTPSRAVLMTGRYVSRQVLPGTDFGVYFADSTGGMSLAQVTVAEVLRGAGYATGLIGKWHLGAQPEVLPNRQGFDRFFGLPYSNDLDPLPLLSDGTPIDDVHPLAKQATLTGRYTEEAIAFMRGAHAAGKPFFLYYANNFPHVPLAASADFAGKSPRCGSPSARSCGLYADVVTELDASVGRILAVLVALGIDGETLVVFTSDNGPWLIQGNDSGSAGPLRSGKGSTFEGGYRVPLIARYPGHIPEGRVEDAPATLLDWMPTLAALAGAKLPTDRRFDGHDILPLLSGAGPRDPSGEPFRLLYYRRDNDAPGGYRKGSWKYKASVTAPESPELPELHGDLLFDLDADVAEAHDVSADHPDVVTALHDEMQALDTALKSDPLR
jgi:arylsulfatase A